MAYYNIFQISKRPIDDHDDLITPDDYYEECYREFSDYMCDEMTEEQQEDAIEECWYLFEPFFERNGRELIFKGADDFVTKWVNEVKNIASNLMPDRKLSFWELTKAAQQTHVRTWHRFVITEFTYECANHSYPDSYGDFVLTLFKSLRPGDKLYIGGIVGFHF